MIIVRALLFGFMLFSIGLVWTLIENDYHISGKILLFEGLVAITTMIFWGICMKFYEKRKNNS